MKYTVEHNKIKVHFDELKEAKKYALSQNSAKLIQHKVILEFTKNSVKIDDTKK